MLGLEVGGAKVALTAGVGGGMLGLAVVEHAPISTPIAPATARRVNMSPVGPAPPITTAWSILAGSDVDATP